jgi:hypothetical protein
MLRVTIALAALVAAGPSTAEQLNVESARQFVVGKLFAFNCFEGTRGTVQFGGSGPVRFVTLPAGTVRAEGPSVCASVNGLPMQPCFNLDKTDPQSFRGSISGLRFAYCDFTRRNAKPNMIRTTEGPRTPLAIHAAAMTEPPSD